MVLNRCGWTGKWKNDLQKNQISKHIVTRPTFQFLFSTFYRVSVILNNLFDFSTDPNIADDLPKQIKNKLILTKI